MKQIAAAGERRRETGRLGQVELDQFDGKILDIAPVAAAPDGQTQTVPRGDERTCHRGADEPGRPRHQCQITLPQASPHGSQAAQPEPYNGASRVAVERIAAFGAT